MSEQLPTIVNVCARPRRGRGRSPGCQAVAREADATGRTSDHRAAGRRSVSTQRSRRTSSFLLASLSSPLPT
jgi:hypothetical protein